jgi:CheY-like chemotaxis protein
MSNAAKTVLIVDDHPAFRKSARQLLESEGYDVIAEAGDGKSALDAATEFKPDVIVLDVQLPDIDGFEVAEQIGARSDGWAPDVVLVSSREASDFGALLDRNCIRGFISKSELSGETIAELLS